MQSKGLSRVFSGTRQGPALSLTERSLPSSRRWLEEASGFLSLIPKEISPGLSLEGMMLKLKLQYFGHLMRRADSLEKTLMLGGIGCQEEKATEDEMAGWHHRLNGREFE